MCFSQGRLGFLVVLQLVLINTMNSLNTSIGLITDFTALGLFIAVGIAMVFAAISEYAKVFFLLSPKIRVFNGSTKHKTHAEK